MGTPRVGGSVSVEDTETSAVAVVEGVADVFSFGAVDIDAQSVGDCVTVDDSEANTEAGDEGDADVVSL